MNELPNPYTAERDPIADTSTDVARAADTPWATPQMPSSRSLTIGTITIVSTVAIGAVIVGYVIAHNAARKEREGWIKHLMGTVQEIIKHPNQHLPLREVRSLGNSLSDFLRHLGTQQHFKELMHFRNKKRGFFHFLNR